ncbi:hypothetical protein [Burkholderia cenocepacia]|uniref:hypothetical protein n=1 Tax=Burkholderia cenocepacia TaxID=95486 RepID=UPI002AB79828|nr:hypothetical protein [Burkholderia cenocepacia]
MKRMNENAAVHPLHTKWGRLARGGALMLAFVMMIAAVVVVLSGIATEAHGRLIVLVVGCALAGGAAALVKFARPL